MPTVSADSQIQENLQESYWAFISFVSEDLPWCDWLYFTLHGYPVPPALAVQSTRYGFPLPESLSAFPDPNDPAHVDQLGAALTRAKFLIVVVSPHSARAAQMDHHLRSFKRAGGEERVIALVVEGQPAPASSLCVRSTNYDWLPRWLTSRLQPSGRFREAGPAEPLVIDARPGFSDLDDVMTSLISTLLDVPKQELEVMDALGRHDGEIARASVLSQTERHRADALTDPSEALLSCLQLPESAPGVRDWRSAGIGLLFLSGAFIILGCIAGVVFLRNCDVPRWKPKNVAPADAMISVPAAVDRDVTELRLQTQALMSRAELLRDRNDLVGALRALESAIQSASRLEEVAREEETSRFLLARLYRSAGLLSEKLGKRDDARQAYRNALEKLSTLRDLHLLGREKASLWDDIESGLRRLESAQ